MLWTTAWRNLWRNKRRTLILAAAVTVGLAAVQFSQAWINGWLRESVDNAVGMTLGHVQVQAVGYYQNPQLKTNLPYDPKWRAKLLAAPPCTAAGPRIRTYGLATTAENNEMAQLIGTDPLAEPGVSIIPGAIATGRWLKPDDGNVAVIGDVMAERLKAQVGRRLVIRAAAPSGELVDAMVHVVGVYRTGLEAFDRSAVYLNLPVAQKFLEMDGRITEWVARAHDQDQTAALKAAVTAQGPPPGAVVTTWQEQEPLIMKTIDIMRTTMFIVSLFFYIAMGFGTANTMLMAVLERTREIGVMLALGIQRRVIVGVIMIEALLLSVVASVLGNIVSWSVTSHFTRVGLDFSSWAGLTKMMGIRGVIYPYLRASDLSATTIAVAVVTLITTIYPAWKASRLEPTVAIRQF